MPNQPSVNSFYSIFDGLLKTNRFTVSMSKLSSQYTDLIESVEFPSLEISTAEYNYNTQPILKIPFAKTPSQTCAISFRVSGSGSTLTGLHQELYKLIPVLGDNYVVSYVSDIWQDITIQILDQDKPIKTFTLYRCLLTTIDSVQLSYDERDSYIKQNTTWSFQDMTVQ